MKFEIPLVNMERELSKKSELLRSAFDSFLRDANLIMGPAVEELEHWMSSQLLGRKVITVANGSDALQLSLECLELPKGSNIVVPGNAGGYAAVAAQIGRAHV